MDKQNMKGYHVKPYKLEMCMLTTCFNRTSSVKYCSRHRYMQYNKNKAGNKPCRDCKTPLNNYPSKTVLCAKCREKAKRNSITTWNAINHEARMLSSERQAQIKQLPFKKLWEDIARPIYEHS